MTPNHQIPDFLRIEIHHDDGVAAYDPNSIIMALVSNPRAFNKWTRAGTRSAISNEPALVYKTHQVEVALTSGEIYRLVMRSLQPEEFFALRKHTGDFFEIHDDFYNPRTGTALQPKD